MKLSEEKSNLFLVSVVVPCWNEEGFIANCLDSLISQDYPKDKLEVLVIDGMSEDRTREVVNSYVKNYSFIKLLDNPKRYVPFGLNIGIKKAKGKIIIRIDAHAAYARDYISKCLRYLEKYKVDNVGGVIKTVSNRGTIISEAIAICLSHFFGAGGSYFRTGVDKPKLVDTVFGGCYKKEVFKKIGLFNENLIRSQDMEFNLRLKKAGGKIILAPDIVSFYYPKDNLEEFFVHNIKDGIWTILPLKFVKIPFRLRHYIPLIFILTLLAAGLIGIFIRPIIFLLFFLIFVYFLFSIYFSVKIALKEKNFKFIFVLPLVFSARHFGYGFGSLWGLLKLIL